MSLADRVLVDASPEAVADADVVLLALPHGASAVLARHLRDDQLVLDLGADHRLRDAADWEAGYGGEHAGAWLYGLAELPATRAALPGSRRVAVPGCYPTTVVLSLAPLVAAGLVEPADLVVVAASGTSGAGRAPSPTLLGSEVMGDLTAYKVTRHQHAHEMTQALTDAAAAAGTGPATLSFTPVLAPLPRGMLATSTARVRGGADLAALRAALHEAYDATPLVHVLPESRWPRAAATLGSASVHLQVGLEERTGRAVVVAAQDNLGKGAAAQAVQCLNLALGFEETAGLAP